MRYMNYLKTNKKALVLSAILMASPLLAATNRPFDPTLLKVNPSTDTRTALLILRIAKMV